MKQPKIEKQSSWQAICLKLSTISIFIMAMAILIATSEADFPKADSEFVTAELNKEATEVSFQIDYTKGPVDFENFPLMINIEIEHSELNESFDFKNQSWVLSTSTPDGEQVNVRTLFRRGADEILSADYGKYTLGGVTSLYGCSDEYGNVMDDDACIPCATDQGGCSFKLSLIREGAPYPAEQVTIQASQWLSSEESEVQLTVSVD
ncbi:MAG: hypothetical protein CMH49_06880 [Myxococcales bacterium]|nr:hypothetical protein [Myxococcales bacterium]